MERSKLIIIFLFICFSCKEPFTPEIASEETNFLVVEGYINIGEGVTTFRLSRTIKLNTSGGPVYETGALVSVEGEDNSKYFLAPHGDGIYSNSLNLGNDKRYRVHITTKNGKEYVSDFTDVITTPSIDSVVWKLHDDGVHINLFTHGEPKTTYYQWEYDEDWQIRSLFTSYFKYYRQQLVPQTNDETVAMSVCWKHEPARDITIYSTAALAEDIVIGFPLIFIPLNTERLSERYHLTVRQHALSREGFEYLTLMKKNTGPLGSFSDPQPSELVGNIHCTTTDEPVVGHIGAYSTATTSFYISRWDVPLWNYDLFCEEIATLNHPDTLAKYFTTGENLPTFGARFEEGTGRILSVFRSTNYCVDCRVRGGTNVKPDFWE